MRQPPPDEQYEWSDPPQGYEIRWVESENWRLATPEEALERKCRRPGCQHKPVAALNRGRRFRLADREQLVAVLRLSSVRATDQLRGRDRRGTPRRQDRNDMKMVEWRASAPSVSPARSDR
jgi:hypothetical protein